MLRDLARCCAFARSGVRVGTGEIKQVMRTQATDSERLAVADDVIDNDGGVEEIEAQVQRLHGVYGGLFGE